MSEDTGVRLLRTLSTCANVIHADRVAALPLLRQAAALHWRLAPELPPLTPHDMEDRLSWPIEDWLDESVRGAYRGPLQIGGFASPTCTDIALEVDESAGLEKVQQIVASVRDSCRLRHDGQTLYQRFRSYLIERPIVQRESDIDDLLISLSVDLRMLYTEIPAHLKRAGDVYPCPCCGWPMNLDASPVTCGSAWCAAKNGFHSWTPAGLVHNSSARVVRGHASADMLMLHPAIWKFTLIPGLLELRIAHRIAELGLHAMMWPGVDAADIQTTIGDTTISIDAKVWRSAGRLAAHIQSLSVAKPCWIVIPDYMARDVPYLRERSPQQIAVFSESGCIKKIGELCKR